MATRQHGIVSRQQLLAAGFTGRAVDHRIAAGRLHPLHPGVYAVGHAALGPRARYMAAVLACGDDAILSHMSAARLWGLRGTPSGPVEVLVARRGGRRHRGITVHVTRWLPDSEVTDEEGIRCTTPARTLVDLAAVVRYPREVRRALERSLELNLFDRVALDAVLERSNGRRGIRMLRSALSDLPDEPPPTAVEIERRLLELIRDSGLPHPVINGQIGGLQVDFHWPAQRVVVETDGGATHGHAIAFHRDRARDLELELANWHVIRLTWRQILHERARVIAALRRRLSAR